jgi:hypothetical protein
MNITECIPLAGRGLVARRGHLVAVTGGTGAGPDPLLTALTAVAVSGGDGTALALAAMRTAAEHGGRPAWACAGVAPGEQVTVLVHGEAVALVSADGSPETLVTASDSTTPVTGTFTGAVVTVRLVIGPPAPPDPRLWLEAGTVFGGGIALTIRQAKPGDLTPNDPHAPAAATMRPATEQAVENMLLHLPPAGPAAPTAPPGVAPGGVYPQDELRLRQDARSADYFVVRHFGSCGITGCRSARSARGRRLGSPGCDARGGLARAVALALVRKAELAARCRLIRCRATPVAPSAG